MPSANKPESTYIYKMGTSPNTRAAISQKNKVYSYVVGKNQFQQLGALTEFSLNDSRSNEKVRGIGMGDQVAEIVPGVTETTLSAAATLLYALNMFQMMGYKGGVDGLVRSIKHTRWPFDVKQELVFSYLASMDTAAADGLGTSGFKPATPPTQGTFLASEPNIKALFTYFEGCWLSSYATSFSSDAGLVANNVEIDVSDVVDGTSFYGEYIDTGLSPTADGNAPGAGASLRFRPNSNQSIPV